MIRRRQRIAAALLTFGVAAGTSIVQAGLGITVVGMVTLHDAEGVAMPAEGARIELTCESGSDVMAAIADEHGRFAFSNVPAQRCSVRGDLQGFDGPAANVVGVPGDRITADLNLEAVPLSVGVRIDRAAANAPIPSPHAGPRKPQHVTTTDHPAAPIRW